MSEIRRANIDDFDKIFAIIEDSFPPDEYRDYEEHKRLFEDNKYTLFVIENGDEIKAFITLWVFEKFNYIEHFAVSGKYRGEGLGSELLGYLVKNLKGITCLEVEPPDTEIAKRRIGFYERNGFYYNDYKYIQPPFSKDKSSVELKIMTTPNSISADEFENIKSTLYKEVYSV